MVFPLGVMADLHWICTHPGSAALAVSSMQCPRRFNWEMKTHRSTIPSPGSWVGHEGKRTQTEHQHSSSSFLLKVALRTNCLTLRPPQLGSLSLPFLSSHDELHPQRVSQTFLCCFCHGFCQNSEQRNNIGHLFGVQTCTFFRPASGVRERKRWDGKEDCESISH